MRYAKKISVVLANKYKNIEYLDSFAEIQHVRSHKKLLQYRITYICQKNINLHCRKIGLRYFQAAKLTLFSFYTEIKNGAKGELEIADSDKNIIVFFDERAPNDLSLLLFLFVSRFGQIHSIFVFFLRQPLLLNVIAEIVTALLLKPKYC